MSSHNHDTYDYNSFSCNFMSNAKEAVVNIECQCGNKFTDSIHIPQPDYNAETAAKSIETDIEEITCDKCNSEYKFLISNSFWGGEIEYIENSKDYDNFNVEYQIIDND